DRTTPAHLLLGALAGLAQAQGHKELCAVAPMAHPSFSADLATRLQTAYGAFWTAEGGKQVSPLAFSLPLPLHSGPTDHLTGRQRKRTLARRAHADAACDMAFSVIGAYLRPV